MLKKILWFMLGLVLAPGCIMLFGLILYFFPRLSSLWAMQAIAFFSVILAVIALSIKNRKSNKYFAIGIWLSLALLLFMIFGPGYQRINKRAAEIKHQTPDK